MDIRKRLFYKKSISTEEIEDVIRSDIQNEEHKSLSILQDLEFYGTRESFGFKEVLALCFSFVCLGFAVIDLNSETFHAFAFLISVSVAIPAFVSGISKYHMKKEARKVKHLYERTHYDHLFYYIRTLQLTEKEETFLSKITQERWIFVNYFKKYHQE